MGTRARLLPFATAATLLVSTVVAAQPPSGPDVDAACTAAYTGGQRLRKKGLYRQAREQLEACARPVCPAVLRNDCTQWRGEVDAAMPSVVVAARMPSGEDAIAVRVIVDGAVLTERIGGLAIDVDPGQHVFRFETAGAQPVEKQLVIREGEKARRIDVAFAATGTAPAAATPPATAPTTATTPNEAHDVAQPSPGPESPSGRTIPTATYVLGGVAVVAFGVGATLEVVGLGQRGSLDACKPTCAESAVSSTRNTVLAGDIGIGVGVLAAAGALYFFVTRPAVQPVVTPTAGGAVFGVSGAY